MHRIGARRADLQICVDGENKKRDEYNGYGHHAENTEKVPVEQPGFYFSKQNTTLQIQKENEKHDLDFV